MKTKILFKTIILLTILVFLFSLDAYAVYWRYSLESALKEAKDSGKPIMVDFYTDWCGWCERLDQDTYTDAKVNELSRNFICVKINAEREPALATRYGVSAFPTIIFLNYEGNIDMNIRGYQGPQEFAQIMEGVLKRTKRPSKKLITEPAKKPQPKPAKKTKKKPGFTLNGIVSDPKMPQAIINDTVVNVGDTIEGATVVRITKDTVELLLQDKTIVLKLE